MCDPAEGNCHWKKESECFSQSYVSAMLVLEADGKHDGVAFISLGSAPYL